MKESYLSKKDSKYELYMQITEYTLAVDVITIIYFNGNWKEDYYEYSHEDFQRLLNLFITDGAISISVNEFEKAQNNILIPYDTTKQGLRNLYNNLWQQFYDLRYKIENEIISSSINLSNYSKVIMMRDHLEKEYDLESLKTRIHSTYQEYGGENVISNKDIFSKSASSLTDKWLKARSELLIKATEK